MTASRINRRHFLATLAGASTLPSSRRSRAAVRHQEGLEWHDPAGWGVEGKGWTDTLLPFDRLPARAQGVVRDPVWDLSRHSAGIAARFVTDARSIRVRYTLLSDRVAMPHMPATGVSGVDLYAQDAVGVERWVAVAQPTAKQVETQLVEGLAPGTRGFTLYYPLYNGVEALEVGVEPGCAFVSVPPRPEKPIVFYGTSILQGACASRPGLAFPAILGRRLNRPHINLGFSGNGHMEPEVASLVAELDACLFAIDCLPNMNEAMIYERTADFVRTVRERRPTAPILLVEDRTFSNTAFLPERRAHHLASRKALKEVALALKRQGVDRLYTLDGAGLIGEDGEGTTDGSHPNDLGMMRYADAYEPALRSLLSQFG